MPNAANGAEARANRRLAAPACRAAGLALLLYVHTNAHYKTNVSVVAATPRRPDQEIPMARSAFPAANPSDDALLARYARRGSECAYANLRMLARVAGTVYDEALRPVDLRAGQLALMWAILAAGPVEIGRLGAITVTDQTTLSRTIAKLKKARLVSLRAGEDRRVKFVALTPTGRQRFQAAMPYWEDAQRRAGELFPLDAVRTLAKRVRRAAQTVTSP